MKYFSVCCIAKNEHPFICEWIDHHILIGAEKIIIFDNNSDPPLRIFLREYIENKIVSVHEINGKEQQIPAYYNCLSKYASEFKWIAFIDVDEFLIPKISDDIRMILTDYEDYGGLGVHWVEFGSSGHIIRPKAFQMKSYVYRFPLDYPKNLHIKSIVQPGKVYIPNNPHRFIYKNPWYCVDENYFPIAESQGPFTAEKVQLNHYYYRSQQDFFQKIDRGRADRADAAGRRKHDAFFQQLKRALKVRLNENKSLNEVLDDISRLISQGKICTAEKNIKKAKILGVEQENIDYINYRIAKKKNNYKESKKYLLKLFSSFVDINICFEYVNSLILNGEYSSAHKMIIYMKWRFSKKIKNDVKIANLIDFLDVKVKKNIQ